MSVLHGVRRATRPWELPGGGKCAGAAQEQIQGLHGGVTGLGYSVARRVPTAARLWQSKRTGQGTVTAYAGGRRGGDGGDGRQPAPYV